MQDDKDSSLFLVSFTHVMLVAKMAAKESAIHFLFFAIFAATLYHNIANIFISGVTNSYGGRFKFLTFINLLLSVLYYGVAVLNDVANALRHCKTKEDSSGNGFSLLKFRDLFFGSLTFPLGFIVTIVFWGVMAFDSELMLPMNLRKMIPVHGLYNHCAHSTPLLFSFLEMSIIKHPHFPSKSRGCLLYTSFCVAYVAWIMWIAYRADIWVYPVLKVLSWYGRAAFLGTAYLLGLCGFFIGYFINGIKNRVHIAKLD